MGIITLHYEHDLETIGSLRKFISLGLAPVARWRSCDVLDSGSFASLWNNIFLDRRGRRLELEYCGQLESVRTAE